MPPDDEQQAIADYLDAETARIDTLIEKKRRMVELLEERMCAEVDERMKSWEHKPLKLLVSYKEGPGIMATDFREDGVPLIRVAGVGGTTVTFVSIMGAQHGADLTQVKV